MAAPRVVPFALLAAIALASPPRAVAACLGDCDGDERVTVAELIRGVGCAVAPIPGDECATCFRAPPSINSLIGAVNNAMHGCVRSDQTVAPTQTPSVDPLDEELAVFTFVPYRQCQNGAPPPGDFDPTALADSLRNEGWRIENVVVTIPEAVCDACGCPVPGSPIVEITVSR